jgi:hypothetical protein
MIETIDIDAQTDLVSGIGADEVEVSITIAMHLKPGVGNGFVDLLSSDHAIGR